jgi:hypothetical protein
MKEDKHKSTNIELHADLEFRGLIVNQIELAVKEKLSLIQSLSK